MKITGITLIKLLSVISWIVLAICVFVVLTQSGIITAICLLIGILISILLEVLRYYGECYEKTDKKGRK